MTAVMGGDRPVSTERVVYNHKPRPTGLDWTKHTAPTPVVPIGNGYQGPETTVEEDVAEIRNRLRVEPKPTPKTRTPRPPKTAKRPPINPDDVIADYQDGKPVADLCTTYNRSTRTIYAILRASGHELRDDRYAPNSKAEDPTLVANVIRLYVDEQLTQTAIIAKVGTSYQTIRKILLMNNIAIRNDRGGRPGTDLNLAEATRLYQAGLSIPQIADQNGWPVVSVRRALQRSGVPMRDDRHNYSGGGNKREDPPELTEQVRQLYVDLHMSQSQIAVAMSSTVKIVQGIMARGGIQARQGECGRGDTLGPYRERLARLGLKTAELRAWADANGHDVAPRALVPTRVLDAYEEARQ